MHVCEVCQIEFKGSKDRRWCSYYCEQKNRVIEMNKKWVDRKPIAPTEESKNRFRKSHVSYNHPWMTKYRACRG